jgi:BCD family chlorophyll transporter-like MFS transporter
MGLWGAAQAISFGMGGLVGTAASDAARWLLSSVPTAYATVFAAEAMLFVLAAYLAVRIGRPLEQTSEPDLSLTVKQGA